MHFNDSVILLVDLSLDDTGHADNILAFVSLVAPAERTNPIIF
jgi:hypothetical protein